jgi:hypothetical protein
MVVRQHARKSLRNATHFETSDPSLTGREFVGFSHRAILTFTESSEPCEGLAAFARLLDKI